MENSHKEQQIKSLVSLDLETRQAEIYLAALAIGGGTVLEISRAGQIERTGIYYYIDQLVELGLLKKANRGTRPIYLPADPSRLKELLKQKEQQLSSVLPSLQDQFMMVTGKSAVTYYQGKDGIIDLYTQVEKILKTMNQKEKVYVFSRTFDAVEVLPEFFPEYFERRNKMAVQSFTILPKSERPTKRELKSTDPLIQSKYSFHSLNRRYLSDESLPEGVGTVLIFRDHVAMIDFKTFFGSLTENKNLAATWRAFFEFIWQHLPEEK